MTQLDDDARLSELQYWMAGLVRRRTALTKDPEISALAPRHVKGSARLQPVEQLEIYREQFWLRHTGSLGEDFPGLKGLLARADWERLLEEYLEHHPPASFTLRDLGHQLPDVIERAAWLPDRDLCADMARLEWAYVELFDAADAPPLDPIELAKLPEQAWEGARIELAPSVRLLALRHPVADLRRSIRAGIRPLELPAPGAHATVVYRRRQELYDQLLAPGAFAILSALARGLPLGAACEQTIESMPERGGEIEGAIGDWFRSWAELGWIARVSAG